VLALVVIISVLVIWFQSSVQDFMDGNNTWNGITDFVATFNVSAVNSLHSLDAAANSTLVVIPSLKFSGTDLAILDRFVRQGGTLILMDDFGHGNDVLQYLKVSVRFAPGVLLDPLFCYKNPEMPKIVSFSSDLEAGSVAAITLNLATSLENVGNGAVLASSADTSFMDLNGNGVMDQNEPKGPFTVAAKYSVGDGKLEVISDPSIIINTMLTLDQNMQFMAYLIKAQGGDNQVYIDKSYIIESPLDIAKTRLIEARRIISNPFALLGALALIFVFVSLNAAGKDGKID
jgi:hypothetical protein